jgi:uncharacterized protein (DUF1499 family)
VKIMRASIALPALLLAACAWPAPRGSTLQDGRFQPCPSEPHCVSTQDKDDRHAIQPIALAMPIEEAWPKIIAVVRDTERTTIVEKFDYYLRAEVESPWHFYVDDLELFWDPEASRLHARSSSRVGYSDFGTNRNRVEALRLKLIVAGVGVPQERR